METKFTPGPWVVSGEIDARYIGGIGDVTLVRRGARKLSDIRSALLPGQQTETRR